ncbi:hypothetical protein BRARA_I02661, partial [Brassica rapa]
MWTSESTATDPRTGEPTFTLCCNHGQIKLPPINQPPALLEKLLQTRWFRDTIRVYNSVLAFTSVGMKMDYSVVHAPGPYTIRIQGQTHHRIGSLLPRQGCLPEYLQLYIFDTANELKNRLNAMGQASAEGNLDESTLALLIEMIDENNCLAKIFRRARDHYESVGSEFTIRLVQDKGKGKEYNLPTTSEVAGMTLIKGGRLLHQFIVDVYTAIEEDRLRWARNNQDILRAELYSNVLDADFKAGTFFKPYKAALHRIEFQKRGLPHAHILLWLGNSTRTPSAEEVDEIISAELPNKDDDPVAYDLVTKHMIH